MIKLVVTDVDGTLVEDGSPNIDPELFETILKLREKGIQFAVASGRPWASVERTFDPVKKKVFYIANNGSYIGCYGRSLYVYPIDRQIMKRLILAVRQIPGLFTFYRTQKIFKNCSVILQIFYCLFADMILVFFFFLLQKFEYLIKGIIYICLKNLVNILIMIVESIAGDTTFVCNIFYRYLI